MIILLNQWSIGYVQLEAICYTSMKTSDANSDNCEFIVKKSNDFPCL